MGTVEATAGNGDIKEGQCKEGFDLLGSPNFEKLENGRFRCVETGHEMPLKAMSSYANCKRCRIGLIDHALSRNKPPLNMFKRDPISSSKIICKLTGHTINKSEEHIWRHINGKRFLRKLEQKEGEMLTSDGVKPPNVSKKTADVARRSNSKEQRGLNGDENLSCKPSKFLSKDSGSEEVANFWMPPVGSRGDFDDGGDQLGSVSDSFQENDEAGDGLGVACEDLSTELLTRTKRMPMEVGPSNFASRKKKTKTDPQGNAK